MTDRPVPSVEVLRPVAQPAAVLGRPNAEHWMGRRLRVVSIHLTRAALRLGVSANAVTGLMIVVGLVAALAFAGSGWWPLLGVAGIELYLLLDCSDGEIARWNRSESALGVYLDRLGHYLVEAAIPVALALRVSGWSVTGWLVVGMAAAIGVLVSKAETDLVDMARHRSGMALMPDEARQMRPAGLARGRQLVSVLPFHRIVHAVEASLLIAVAVIVDELTDGLTASEVVLVAIAVSAGLTAVLHLVSVLASTRLTAE